MLRALLILCLFAATASGAAQSHGSVIIIANLGVKASAASKAEIQDVFSGEASSLKGGIQVTPVLLRSGSANDAFLALYLGQTATKFRTNWRSLVFSGQATMPRSLDTEMAVVDFVAHNPGTIGYISRSTPHEGVKVISGR